MTGGTESTQMNKGETTEILQRRFAKCMFGCAKGFRVGSYHERPDQVVVDDFLE